MSVKMKTLDANEAVAKIAHAVSEVVAIYPITPSSPMGEWADQWSSERAENLWGSVPRVIEMQSEAGVAGAVHGALQAGSLTTTFTASQGLLLMIPNMYKIAGELTPAVFHVAARSLAAQGLSIFGDHSDVMAARQTGFAMLCSNSVQEAQDLALIAHAATLEARLPFLHFFDGFRTSHEVGKIALADRATIRAMIDDAQVRAHRERALTPDRPRIRGTAQNPDVYFQARETVNPFYRACPEIVQQKMDQFAALTGRQYQLYEYEGAADAEQVIIIMGSGTEAVRETVAALNAKGAKTGVLRVRLFRPFDIARFAAALPATVKKIAVLDRCKEPGAPGEPLYLETLTALSEAFAAGQAPFTVMPRIYGGRYGLSSKEFTPAMIKGIFDELAKEAPKNHFTIGIIDDVTHTSLDFDPAFSTEDPKTVRAVFYGLGADGTVGANKNSIKIIGEETDNYAQGYFVYDSKKSGSMTTSHLRFGPNPIRSTYLITRASFVAVHQFPFVERMDVLKLADHGATVLLNSPHPADAVWDKLPRSVQQEILSKELTLYVIDAAKVAREAGMGGRINTVMQTCFFAISNVLPREEAIARIKDAIKKTYGKRGDAVVKMNWDAVDSTVEHLYKVEIPGQASSDFDLRPAVPDEAPEFVRQVTARMMAGEGDLLPVSALPNDGTYPTGTTKWEKRNIAQDIPVWDPDTCIQCGKCVMVCPHSVIRAKIAPQEAMAGAPEGFLTAVPKWKEFHDEVYTLQVAAEDCTGCGLCVEVCPAKNKREVRLKAINMEPQAPLREAAVKHWSFFEALDHPDRDKVHHNLVKDVQLLEPLIEFSGACAGCGETPYIKLVTQLFGDRALIANATGCSSIYGGNLPTTPYTMNAAGRGPAWANSLFEDNAEFGLGMRASLDTQERYARELLRKLAQKVGEPLVDAILSADQATEDGINFVRARVADLREQLAGDTSPEAEDLRSLADQLVRKSVWIFGGDGWAYDIGYGGLDHLLSTNWNVNVLVLDTEVYSNTGGQCSKATPRGAVAKFAAGGKPTAKKDLALIAMTYGSAYVARVAMGSNDTHTVRALREAEAYDGPSIVIAYSHCIAHGYDLRFGMEQQKNAVLSGHWPLFRYNPERAAAGENPFQLDSKAPSLPLEKYIYNETRYKMLARSAPEVAKELLHLGEQDVAHRWQMYEYMASMPGAATAAEPAQGGAE
ncbi:MAG: pyruvate:ferredoxin (flavodoxin) oxidoreductase [Candidatus Hydrogenedens sp.]|nr:pyruvate:ferredoxin (flavodoxin) oxidoreductase [Candidatus Hydrogenedens sp.]